MVSKDEEFNKRVYLEFLEKNKSDSNLHENIDKIMKTESDKRSLFTGVEILNNFGEYIKQCFKQHAI